MKLDQSKIIKEVKAYVRNAHMNQTRKFGGDKGRSYFDTHISRVAISVETEDATFDQIVAAWLHDTKEDQIEWWNPTALISMGVTENALEIVDAVTKREGENYFDFIQRIIQTPDAILVKIADIKDNMSDLKEGSMKDKYRFALRMLESELNCNNWVQASNEGNL